MRSDSQRELTFSNLDIRPDTADGDQDHPLLTTRLSQLEPGSVTSDLSAERDVAHNSDVKGDTDDDATTRRDDTRDEPSPALLVAGLHDRAARSGTQGCSRVCPRPASAPRNRAAGWIG
jgi:hypothetical protein